jgi:type IV pilus assembly protein PilE
MSNVSMNRRDRIDGRLQAGFTLIEMMIVVVIIAILASIAWPSYIKQVTKTNRVAAEACLSQYANYMERYYTTNMSYSQSADATPVPNTLPTLDCASPSQTGNNYGYAFVAANLTPSTFLIQATPIPGGAQAKRDTMCGTLSLDQTGGRLPTTAGCW